MFYSAVVTEGLNEALCIYLTFISIALRENQSTTATAPYEYAIGIFRFQIYYYRHASIWGKTQCFESKQVSMRSLSWEGLPSSVSPAHVIHSDNPFRLRYDAHRGTLWCLLSPALSFVLYTESITRIRASCLMV